MNGSGHKPMVAITRFEVDIVVWRHPEEFISPFSNEKRVKSMPCMLASSLKYVGLEGY